jgi:hypothetical protein
LSLRAGAGVVALFAGISGALALRHFRKKLKLTYHGKVTSFLPGIFLPTTLAGLFHTTVSH